MTQKHSATSLKAKAIDFLRLASSGKVQDAYQLYVRDDFNHHNPFFKGDRQSLMTAMEENARQNPNKIFEVRHALQDGEFVAVHSRVRQSPEEPGAVVVHIFRFGNDRIAELWDLGMAVPQESVNENGIL